MVLKIVRKKLAEESERLWLKKQEMNEQLYLRESKSSLALSFHDPEYQEH